MQQAFVDAYRAGEEAENAAAVAGYKNPAGQAAKLMDDTKIHEAIEGIKHGDWGDGAKSYAFRTAIERISGVPLDEGFQTFAMQRGNELEPEARREHEKQAGILVSQTGIVLTDDELFGASADGLIDDDGGSEYKCFLDPGKLRTVIIEKDLKQFHDQIQGCLWITGRKWWHFGMYVPALKAANKQLTLIKVERDDEYIEELEKDLVLFNDYVELNVKMIKES